MQPALFLLLAKATGLYYLLNRFLSNEYELKEPLLDANTFCWPIIGLIR